MLSFQNQLLQSFHTTPAHPALYIYLAFSQNSPAAQKPTWKTKPKDTLLDCLWPFNFYLSFSSPTLSNLEWKLWSSGDIFYSVYLQLTLCSQFAAK